VLLYYYILKGWSVDKLVQALNNKSCILLLSVKTA